jgi:hypothetical protein
MDAATFNFEAAERFLENELPLRLFNLKDLAVSLDYKFEATFAHNVREGGLKDQMALARGDP